MTAQTPDPAPKPPQGQPQPARRKYVRAVGPKLKYLLVAVFGLTAVLSANSAYLLSITFMEWLNGFSYQNYFYQIMFLAHLVLGLLLLVPFVVFSVVHIVNTKDRTNKRAIRVGYLLFFVSLVLLLSGVALMRVEGFELKDPNLRSISYWSHILTPVLVVWLYILHRLAGPKIRWRVGLGWGVGIAAVVAGMVAMHAHDPRAWGAKGPKEGEKYFRPALTRTATGNFIPPKTMMMDSYCQECHQDGYEGWFHSAHHFSSFNNPAYLFTIRQTREVALKRDGSVKASRWCAGCHDPVPFLSGAFDDPNFDLEKHPTSQAGITCTACHSIVNINSTTGNGDYTIEEPIHYPFAFSTNKVLKFVNRTLVKAKPDFHKKVFLKPLHKSAEFCSTCHKVSIPYEVNHYKDWLRGQNHYDSFLLSGVSGHSARSFYYPEVAKENCASCHMPLQASKDFGAAYFNPTNKVLSIHDHFFPSANTALPYLRGETNMVARHQKYLTNTVRLDLLGLRDGGTVDSPLLGPLRPTVPTLQRGRKYLLEVVLRTLTLGHLLTQGTVDSNELWVDVRILSGGRVIGRSGGLGDKNEVDPWSHFVNVYMLDKDGNRIDRRNAQDIFTPLYNHQIPPGAAQVVHYGFELPEDLQDAVTIEASLRYRKFDATYLKYVYGPGRTNDLPITTMASDTIILPVEGTTPSQPIPEQKSAIVPWQRWNDYGIGLLLEGDKGSEKGELIQATEAFKRVEQAGRSEGAVNQARVFFKEGRLDDTVAALQRAAKFDPPPPRWLVAWFNGLVNKQNGYLDKAITEFKSILEDRYPELERRKLDFSKDYEVINELGQTLYERAKMERGAPKIRLGYLVQAKELFERTLALDSENLAAHYNLALIHEALGNATEAETHRKLHEKYRPDDNARDRAITIERRRNPAADHAAQSIVIYPLQRQGAPGLPRESARPTLSSR